MHLRLNEMIWRGRAWHDWLRVRSRAIAKSAMSGFYLLNTAVLLGTMPPGDDPDAAYLFLRLAQLLSIAGVMLFVKLFWRFHQSSQNPDCLWDIGHAAIKFIAFSIASLWLVREMGKEVIDIVSAHSAHSVMFVVAVGVTAYIFKLCSSLQFASRFDPVLKVATSRLLLSRHERRVCAVHEAGHTALCAALKELPSTFEVQISDRWNTNGPLAFVRLNVEGMLLPRREVLYWQMLLLLAGTAAEQRLLGATSAANQTDAVEWENQARSYLLSFEIGSYFGTPRSMAEADWNSRKLRELQREQRDWLDAFMQTNEEQLHLIAALLERKGRMTRRIALERLAAIEFSDRCPNPIINEV